MLSARPKGTLLQAQPLGSRSGPSAKRGANPRAFEEKFLKFDAPYALSKRPLSLRYSLSSKQEFSKSSQKVQGLGKGPQGRTLHGFFFRVGREHTWAVASGGEVAMVDGLYRAHRLHKAPPKLVLQWPSSLPGQGKAFMSLHL